MDSEMETATKLLKLLLFTSATGCFMFVYTSSYLFSVCLLSCSWPVGAGFDPSLIAGHQATSMSLASLESKPSMLEEEEAAFLD